MKKLFTATLAVLLAVILTFPVFASSAKMGDVDGNGKVNAADARATLRVSAKLDVFTDEQFARADVDSSGKITASDARLILRVSAKLDEFEETEALPAAIQALYDGKFKITEVYDYESMYFDNYLAVADGAVYVVGTVDFPEDNETYTNGTIIAEDGVGYEFDMNEMAGFVIDEDYMADGGDITYLNAFKSIGAPETQLKLGSDYIGSKECDIYIFCTAYGTLKFYLHGEEVVAFACYDTYGNEIINMQVTEFLTDFDESELPDLGDMTVYPSYDEYFGALYGDIDWDDGYWTEEYYDEEYWADIIDWSDIEETEITNEADLPEEYAILASEDHEMTFIYRSVAPEEDILTVDGYNYMECSVANYGNIYAVEDQTYGIGLLQLYIFDTDSEGNETLSICMLDANNMNYAPCDELLSEMLGMTPEDMGITGENDFDIISETPASITVQQTELDGVTYKRINCTFDGDTPYTESYCFADGELIRADFYENGKYAGTMLVRYFSAEVSEDTAEMLNLDNYTKVGSFELFMSMLEF